MEPTAAQKYNPIAMYTGAVSQTAIGTGAILHMRKSILNSYSENITDFATE